MDVPQILISFIEDLVKRTTRKFLSKADLHAFHKEVSLQHKSILEAITQGSEARA